MRGEASRPQGLGGGGHGSPSQDRSPATPHHRLQLQAQVSRSPTPIQQLPAPPRRRRRSYPLARRPQKTTPRSASSRPPSLRRLYPVIFIHRSGYFNCKIFDLLRKLLDLIPVLIVRSLQSKVKRLEEERQDGGVNKDDEPKPDLEEEEDSKGRIRSENDKTLQDQGEPGRSKPLDHENQSVNGSNSTCSKSLEDHNKSDRVPTEPNQLPTGSAEPSKAHSDSNKGSCETVPKKRRQADAAAETRESSEAQSSASLTRRTERKRRRTVELQDQPNEQVLGKSQPLVAILQMIRAQEHSSLFERRLTSQVFLFLYYFIIIQINSLRHMHGMRTQQSLTPRKKNKNACTKPTKSFNASGFSLQFSRKIGNLLST